MLTSVTGSTLDRVSLDLEPWHYQALSRYAQYTGTTPDSLVRTMLTRLLTDLGWGPMTDGARVVQPAIAVVGGKEPAPLDQPEFGSVERRRYQAQQARRLEEQQERRKKLTQRAESLGEAR